MIEYPTIRYRCDHCRKSYARKGSCATHEAECQHDPAVRACTTCVHFEPGRPLANGCAVDAFPVFYDWDGRDQIADFVRRCTEWEPARPARVGERPEDAVNGAQPPRTEL